MTIIKELDALHVNWEEYKFPAGEWDMKYADFSLVEKTGATVTLDLFSYVEPSANFTVNAPSEIKEGQEYILRVENWATAYTMTLGENIENPYYVDLSLTQNWIDQFVFFAVDWKLELQAAIDESSKIFYISSTSDIAWAEKVLNYFKRWFTPFVRFWTRNLLYTLDYNSISNNSITFRSLLLTDNSNNSYSEKIQYYITLNLYYDEVNSISDSNIKIINWLDTDTNYSTPYVPKYDWSPATKKYVKDKVNVYSFAIWTWLSTEEKNARQWPCPDWYHIPSETEWGWIKSVMSSLWNTTWDSRRIKLHMPFAWVRSFSSSNKNSEGSRWYYWWSDVYDYQNITARCAVLYSNTLYVPHTSSRGDACSIRAFKDSYVTPESDWTVIQWTLWSAWIFRDQTNWLISITSNWTTWYTIMDKNLWATTVYSDWDTLTQDNMGNMYQFWNNYWFPSTWTISNISSTQINADDYWPKNPYYSSTFIKWWADRTTDQNPDLWWGKSWTYKSISVDSISSWDMNYSDFNRIEKTWATITLDLNSYIEPSADFTVNAPSTIEDWQRYILRVVTWATPYTMTLWTWITNPYSESTTLLANTVHQFGFLAIDWDLELQPSVTQSWWWEWWTITWTLSNQTDLQTALNAKANASDVNTKLFRLSSNSDLTTAQAAYDWRAAWKNPIITHWDWWMMRVLYSASTTRLEFVAEWYYSNWAVTPNWNISEKGLYVTYIIANSSWVVTSITAWEKDYIRYLNTNVNYPTPYIPQYDWSPATKKYVDDNVAYVWSSAPSSPSEWRLWYDTTNDVLKSYDGTNWNECWGWVNKSWVTKTVSSWEIELGIRTLVNDPSANFTLTKPATLIDWEEYAIRINSWSTARTMTLWTGFTNPWNVSLSLNAQATDQFVFLAINNTLELQPLITIS